MKTITKMLLILGLGIINASGQNAKSTFQRSLDSAFQKRLQKGVARQSSACMEDSVISASWDNTANIWHNIYRSLFSYDSQGNLNKIVSYIAPNPSSAVEKRTTTFDVNHNTLSELIQVFNTTSNSFINEYLASYSYDSYHNLIQVLNQSWDGISTWQNVDRSTNTYDQNNNMISELTETVSATPSGWQNFSLLTYTFSGHNMLAQQTVSWDTATSAWINIYLYVNTYNSSNKLSTALTQIWSTSTSNWENSYYLAYTYNGNNLITSIGSTWNGSSWINNYKINSSYDANGNGLASIQQYWDIGTSNWINTYNFQSTYDPHNNVISEINQHWIQTNNTWKNMLKNLYTYDSYDNRILGIYDQWNDTTSSWEHGSEDRYYYDCSTVGIKELTGGAKNFKIYPNPAQSELFIESATDFKTIRFTNLSGQIITARENSKSVLVSDLQSGIYFIQLLDKNGSVLQSEKFVKE